MYILFQVFWYLQLSLWSQWVAVLFEIDSLQIPFSEKTTCISWLITRSMTSSAFINPFFNFLTTWVFISLAMSSLLRTVHCSWPRQWIGSASVCKNLAVLSQMHRAWAFPSLWDVEIRIDVFLQLRWRPPLRYRLRRPSISWICHHMTRSTPLLFTSTVSFAHAAQSFEWS